MSNLYSIYLLVGGGPGSLIMIMVSVPRQQYFACQTLENPVVEEVRFEDSLPPISELVNSAINLPINAMADLGGTTQMLMELGIILEEDG